jgi:glucose/arabinose dehydrogenase
MFYYKSYIMQKYTFALFFILLIKGLHSTSQPLFSFTPAISSGLINAVDVTTANDGTNRIFVVQQGGTVKVYDNNFTILSNNFLTISSNFTSGGERGLLSIAFHPDYENNRYFFVYYTNAVGGVNIDRFRTLLTDPNKADDASRTNILSITKPVAYANHNGGKLNFGADGNLYAGFGDSGSSGDPGNLAQNGNSLWGKMIRINVDGFATSAPFYTIPPSNPFISNPAVLDEIFSLGLRNPWRWSFDRLTGNMWIADVGQNVKEEVNNLTLAQASGANYGWRCYEGLDDYITIGCQIKSSYTFPIFDYPHNNATGGFSITGGYVYRGTQYPAMYGYYICADYLSGNIWAINASNNASTIQTSVRTAITGFAEQENGELLALTLAGTLYRVTTSSVLPLKLESWAGFAKDNYNQLSWQTKNEIDISSFEVEYSTDGVVFSSAGNAVAKNQSRSVYSFRHYTNNSPLFYRLKIINLNGKVEFSNIIKLNSKTLAQEKIIYPLNGSTNSIWLNVAPNEKVSFQLFNFSGQTMLRIPAYNNNKIIDLQKLPTGIYIGKITTKDKIITEKIMIGN